MAIKEVVSLFSNLFCCETFYLFSHDLSDAWWDRLEDVFLEDVVDFHILDVILEAQEIL